MKITVTDELLTIEDGPELDPTLSPEDALDLSRIHALTWLARRNGDTLNQILRARNERAIYAEQANQIVNRIRMGMH